MTKPVFYRLVWRASYLTVGMLLVWIVLDIGLSGSVWSGMRISQSALTVEYCEFDHTHRFFRQPVNTYSNLVYCWLGLLVLGMAGHDARRTGDPRLNRLEQFPSLSALMGVCLVYLGVGSGFFHASLTYVGQRMDMHGTYAVLLTLLGIAFYHALPARPTPSVQKRYWILLLVALIVLFLKIALWIPSSRLVLGLILLVNLLMIIQYVRFRKTYVPGLIGLGFGLVLMAIKIRTLDVQKIGCDPHSLWQGHALWHVLAGLSTFSSYAFYRFTNNRSSNRSTRNLMHSVDMVASYWSDSVVIVTGAASGIGRELALQAAAQNASVVAADIDSAGLEATRQQGEPLGGDVQTVVFDVADKGAVHQFAERVIPTLRGRRLVLINNAGVALLSHTFEQTDPEDMEWLFAINFWGPVRLTKAFYPYFLAQNKGHIVNLSSVFGLAGFPHQSAYSAAKFALRGFTETLRIELMGTGVGTTCVHPGGIKTSIARNARVAGGMGEVRTQAVNQFDQLARTSPAEAARQILRAVETKKQRLLIGPDARLLDLLVRLLPVGYSRLIKRQTDKVFGLYPSLDRKSDWSGFDASQTGLIPDSPFAEN